MHHQCDVCTHCRRPDKRKPLGERLRPRQFANRGPPRYRRELSIELKIEAIVMLSGTEMENQNIKLLYIAGSGRSGTTMLARLLGELDGFVNGGEAARYLFDAPMQGRQVPCGCGRAVSQCSFWKDKVQAIPPELAHQGAEVVRMRKFGSLLMASGGAEAPKQYRPILEAITAVYRKVAQETGCRVIVDSSKNPANDGSQKNLTNSVKWSSSASTITGLDAACVATGHKLGTTTIAATASGVAGSTILTVSGVQLLAVTPANPGIPNGGTQQFHATAILVGQQTHTQDLTSQVTWTASPASTATVSNTGLATGAAAGSATITATLRTYSGSAVLNVSSTPPPNLGQWSAPFGVGAIGIHAALLYTGQVLLYQYGTPYGNGNRSCCSLAKVFDPNTYSVTDVTLPFTRDIFCSGLSMLANGQVIITGGTYDPLHEDAGIFDTTIFDPPTGTWSSTGLMDYARWYPSNVELPDGTTLTMAGSDQTGKGRQRSLEIFHPTTGAWTALPASANMQDKPEPELYPSLFLLPSGSVVDAGPNQTTRVFNPATKT